MGGEGVRITELRIPDDNLFERLTAMRVWLDEHVTNHRPSPISSFIGDDDQGLIQDRR